MRRLISILVAALTFLAATAQVQLKVKTNDDSTKWSLTTLQKP